MTSTKQLMIFTILFQLTDLRLTEPHWLWLALVAPVLVILRKRLRIAFAHTSTSIHKATRNRDWTGVFVAVLLVVSWASFCIALTKPRLVHQEMRRTLNARDFVIGIDRSGSMFASDIKNPQLRQEIDAFAEGLAKQEKAMREAYPKLYPYPPDAPQATVAADHVRRFDLARYAAFKFLGSRPQGDRAALFTFDDDVYWAWPLGSDLNVVSRKTEELSTSKQGGGTNFEGPTQNNPRQGAFQATINHLEKLAKAKTRVLIFVSDGDAGISPERHQALVEQMKRENQEIHIFALVCGAKTQLDNASTQSLRKLVEAVNPQNWHDSKGEKVDAVLWAGDGEAMKSAFARINELEKSAVELEPIEGFKDVTFQFILLGALSLAGLLVACTLLNENF